jgi:hypothetical protein
MIVSCISACAIVVAAHVMPGPARLKQLAHPSIHGTTTMAQRSLSLSHTHTCTCKRKSVVLVSNGGWKILK